MTIDGLDERHVKEIIASVYNRSPRDRPLEPEEIGFEQPLYPAEEGEESLGLDSLDAVEIATELEEAFDLVLPTEIDPAEVRTVRQLLTLLQRLRQEQHGAS